MTAHPQTQPMLGTVPVATPAVADETPSKAKGAGRNAKMALALSLLVATAGVSFAVGHVTAEEGTGTAISPFAAGGFPAAAASDTAGTATTTEAATAAGAASTNTTDGVTDVTVSSMGSDPAGPPAAAAAATSDSEAEGVPDKQMARGERPDIGAMPGGSEGTVTETTDVSLTVTATDGSTQTFVIDGTTAWVQQEAIDASTVQAGATVTVDVPFAGPGSAETDTSTAATQVTVTAGI